MGPLSPLLSRRLIPSAVVRAFIPWAILLLAIPAFSSFAQESVAVKAKAQDEVEHLLKEFPKGWLHFSSEPANPLNATWQIQREQQDGKEPKDGKETVLICLGKPDGYIRTEKEYENFELGLEWKYPMDPNGNSGILLYTVEKDMIWPKSIQVQLHRPTAGSVFPSNGAKVDNPLLAKDLSEPINVWNKCLITSLDGKISVTLNDHKVGDTTGCMPQKGCVGLQSEGSEIHFRNLWIKPLPPSDKRISSRKVSMRHKNLPACPPEYVIANSDGHELPLLTPAEAHRAKIESQRATRVIRRLQHQGRLPPSAFQGLSPYGTPETNK